MVKSSRASKAASYVRSCPIDSADDVRLDPGREGCSMLLGRFVLSGFVLASVERSSETRSCCCGASLAKVGSGAEPDSFVAEEFRDRKDGTL